MKKILLILCFALFQLSHGQSIWTNPITDVNPSATNPYSNGDVKNANITVSGIRRSASVNAPATTPNIFTATGWRGAFNVLRYYEFSMSPQSGYKINFINFSFNTGTTGASPVTNFELRSSIDGFEYPIGTVLNGANTISLSDSDFQNVTSTVVFRIYAWGAANNRSSFGITDFTFNGNVVINGTPSQSIWTNAITDANPSFSNPYTIGDVKDANITVSGIRRGSGLQSFIVANRYDATGWPNANLNVNDYFEFTLTPNSSYKINLQSFVFDGQTAGATAPNKFALQSSLDNYTSQIVVVEDLNIIDLSNAIYQNLTAPITFRLYAWGATDNLGRYGINSFTFNGTTTVDAQSDESIWSNPIINADPSASNPFTAGSARNPNITVSGIARGTGILPRTTVNRYDATGWDSSSLDTNDYYQFTLTPNSGFKINLNSFVFDGQVASASAPINFALRSSLDDYSGSIGIVQEDSNTIDLTNAIYQNLASPITFRLYAWGATASDGRYGINSFQFKGNVVASSCITPTITTTGIIDSVCFNPTSTTTVILPYTATTGNPVGYSIDWNVAASAAGLIDQSNSSQIFNSGSGNVNIVIAANIPVGTYEGVMTIGTGSCIVSQVVSLTVLSNTASAASSSPTVCLNSALTNITHTTTGATGIGTATGLPAGVSAAWSTDTITISGTPSETGTFNYSIPLTGGCGSINATGTIIVSPNVTPLFSPLTNLCFGESIPPLPVTSINGIIGTWSPALNNTATTTYTFTPNAGQCGTTATLTIIVRPAFTAGEIATLGEFICIGGDPTLIGSVTTASGGDSGIIYRWSSSTDGINYSAIASTNSATYDPPSGLTVKTWYRREARDGSCNTNFNDAGNLSIGVWIVDVSAILTPTFSAVAPICSGATLSALPTTSDNGITGTWSPALNNTATTTYTFTPDSGQCGTTTTLSITVNPSLPASVSIVANPPSAICAGDNVTFTATPTNGGTTPTYQWKINGTDVSGQTGATFSTTSLVNNDAITVVMTSNATCATGSPATSNAIVKVVFDIVVPSVSVLATSTTICTGESVTFTATPTNGGSPSYQWKVNGTDVSGETAATFTSNSLANNDVVTVVMTSSLPFCLSTPTATSTGIIITVNPSLPASVSIMANPVSAICAGANVTFTATPTNGGTTPTYQWKVNGSNVSGETGATFSTTSLANNDAVSVVMTSNATCATGSPATSNAIVKVVFDIVVPSVSVLATSTTICTGESVTFTATPTNGGTPSYQWKVNGTDVSGETAATFTSNSLANNDVVTVVMTSSLPFCLSTPTATSTGIIMTVNPILTPTFTAVAPICFGATLSALPTTSNNGITGTWSPVLNNTTTTIYTFTPDSGQCGSTTTLTISVLPVFNPGAIPNSTISAPGETICGGGDPAVIGSTTPASGGDANITYRWSSSTDGFIYFPIASSNSETYDPPAGLTVTTRYLREAIDGTCNTDFALPSSRSTGRWIVQVDPINTVGSASGSPTVCLNAAITNITHTTTGAKGIGTASGLPAGVSASWSSDTITISGTPSASGTFNYSIPLTGGCGSATATGAITVLPEFLAGAIPNSTISAPGETICSGGDPAVIGSTTPASGGDSNITYRWSSSTDGFIYIPIDNSNLATYDPPAGLTVTTRYLREAIDGTCNTDFALPSSRSTGRWIVEVTPAPNAPTIGTITNASCSGTGSVVLNDLPSGSWLINQTGAVIGAYVGSGNSYTISGLVVGNYNFTVSVGSCTSDAVAATISSPGTTTWTGSPTPSWDNGAPTSSMVASISANYSQAADINACSLTVNNNAVVTIPSGSNVILDGAITVSSGSFTLENNANLVQVSNAANSGAIIIKRDNSPLFRLDYTMWSSPVTGTQTLIDFSPLTDTTRFYEYNSTTNLYNAVPINGIFSPAKGYLIRMPNTWGSFPGTAASWTGTFTGTPNNGNIPFTMSTATDGYNAVGNPYPSTLNMANFINANAVTNTNIDGTLYFWRKTNDASNPISYTTCTTAGCTLANGHTYGDDDFISIGQGFIVKALTTTLNFNNSMRVANNTNQFFKTKQIEKNRIWLKLSKESNLVNQMLLAYMTGATDGIDPAIDGAYFNDSAIALNSLIGSKEFAVQGRRLPFDVTDVVRLAFKTNTAGNFTIAIDQVDGLFSGSKNIILKDNSTGTETDLKEGSYVFYANAGVDNTRFSLKYQKILKVDDSVFNEKSVTIYKNNGIIYVNSKDSIINTIQVFDVQGRLIAEQKNVKANSSAISILKVLHQVLIVKVTSEDNKVVNKKVVE